MAKSPKKSPETLAKTLSDLPDASAVPDIQLPPAEPAPRKSAPRKLGLDGEFVVVDRNTFEELTLSLLGGNGDRYSSTSLPSHYMKLFGVETRAEAIAIIQELRASHTERKAITNAG